MNQVHPIEQQVADFLAEKRPGRGNVGSSATLESYEMTVRRKFLPWVQSRGLTDGKEFTIELWNAYKDELRNGDLADASVQTYLRGAKIFLSSLDLPITFIKKLKPPKAAKRLLEIPTREEIDELEAAATNERDKLIVRVLANTGIRLSELTGLKAKDLREITSPVRHYRLRVLGKGSKEREVPIDRAAFLRLEKFARTGGMRAYIFPAMQHDRKAGALVMMDGARLTNNAVDKMFRTLKDALKIPKARKLTPHTLRHAFATWALQNGMSHEQLRLILGHRDYSMIVGVYAHLSPDDASREYERVFGAVTERVEPRRRKRIA